MYIVYWIYCFVNSVRCKKTSFPPGRECEQQAEKGTIGVVGSTFINRMARDIMGYGHIRLSVTYLLNVMQSVVRDVLYLAWQNSYKPVIKLI